MQAVNNSSASSNGQSQPRAATGRKRKGGISPPTMVELRGVNIHFPFRPYKCQEAYMGKVLDALLNKQNALLESPTGTGKTLCLLCATLAWQREQGKLLRDPEAQRMQQQHQQPISLQSDNGTTTTSKQQPTHKKVPTIIYASRTHSQLSQVVRELRNTRYRPRHAVLGSREQMCVHPKVKKPTSTGSDINHDCNVLAKERKCRFRNQLEGFTAPSDGNNNNTQQPVLDMEDLVAMGKKHKVCPFYYTRSILADAELVLMPYNYLFDKDARETTLQDIVWSNAVVIFDEAHNLESFATESASFDLTQTDLAICVAELERALNFINLMGDEDSTVVKRDNLIRLKGLFLNFEAYLTNLSSSGAFDGSYMMELFTKGMSINWGNHQLFIDEVKKVCELLLDAGGGSKKGAPKLEHMVQCIKRVFGEPSEARCIAKAKNYRVHLSPKGGAPQQQQQGSRSNNNNKSGAGSASRTLSYWCFAPSLSMHELESLQIRSILVTSGTLSPLPSYSMELGLSFPHTLENPHIISDDQIHVRVIGKGVGGKNLTSSYQRRQDADYYTELGNTLVSLAKIIPDGMLVFFPSYSVMESCIERWGGPTSSSSRFNNNKNNKTSNFFAARNRKGKQAANRQQYSFPFAAPSIYGSSLGSASNPITPWKRLLGAKSVVVEPRSSADLPDAISEFHKYLAMPKSKGVALFGICRGKISEGIDFSGNQSRAVVVTGLPFPPAFDPRVKLKREYLDKAKASKSMKSKEAGGFGGSSDNKVEAEVDTNNVVSLSGSAWYNQQAHRACNQAIGRVIRNKDDYGAVLLLDSRYSQPANQQGLSKWVRPHLQRDEGMGVAISSLARFYRRAEAQAKEREEAKKGIVLEYEQEEEEKESKKLKQPQEANVDEAFTKVAFVQNLTRDLKVPKGSQSDPGMDEDKDEPVSYIAPERVLARVDVDRVVQKKEAVFEDQSKIAKANFNSNAQKSVFASSAAQRMPSKQNSGPTRVVGNMKTTQSTNNTPKLDSKQAAALFFRKAQKWLSAAEFSSIRKALVAMKQHGEKEDTDSYLKAAKSVASLCCQREQFFGQHEAGHKETMLFLFFQLLPRARRKQVEVKAMATLFRRSTLGQSKTSLPPEQYSKLLNACSKFLQQVWCDSGSQLQRAEFLQEAEKVLDLLQGSNESESSSLTSSFTKMVPSRFSTPLQALLSEREASRNIKRMKTTEAKKVGEDSIEVIRFQRNAPPPGYKRNEGVAIKSELSKATAKQEVNARATAKTKRPPQATLERAPPTSQEGPTSKALKVSSAGTVQVKPPFAASQSNKSGAAGKDVAVKNPYAKKPKSRSLSSYVGNPPAATKGKTESSHPHRGRPNKAPNRAPPAYTRQSELTMTGKPTNKKNPSSVQSDPVSKMLQHVESHPFVRKSAGDIVKTLNSNVPANMRCVICTKTAVTPMLSDCSHMACQACWLQWLKKSPTCPVCRLECKTNSLARVVFQDQYTETTPAALSQLCE